MKKRLFFMNKQDGYILPFTLFITTIVLLIVSTNITLYSRDNQTTHKYMEQIKVQTLFQMGREKFKQQIDELDTDNKVMYIFPSGTVEIEYTSSKAQYHLFFSIYTEDGSVHKLINTLKKPLDNELILHLY